MSTEIGTREEEIKPKTDEKPKTEAERQAVRVAVVQLTPLARTVPVLIASRLRPA